jgi:hypothetical protein
MTVVCRRGQTFTTEIKIFVIWFRGPEAFVHKEDAGETLQKTVVFGIKFMDHNVGFSIPAL